MIKRLSINTPGRSSVVDVTARLAETVRESAVQSGLCHVFVPHTTAGITINEGADPDVPRDVLAHLEKLVPWVGSYAHSEGNSAAHIKAALVGHSTTVFVEGGRLVLGTWQAVFLCEFDGPRQRTVLVKVVAG